jgi:hypothetical protein
MTGNDVIHAFGGLGALHELTGASRASCEQWKRNGVPPKYWHVLVAAATVRKIRGITFEALEATRVTAPNRAPREGGGPFGRDRAA